MSGLLAAIAASAVLGQPSGQERVAQTQPTTEVRNLQVADVPGATPDIVRGGAVDLAISEKESELTFSYVFGGRSQVSHDGYTAEVVQDAFSIELSLPLGGGDSLLDDDLFNGLLDGPSLSLSWTSFGTRSGDPFDLERNPAIRELASAAQAQCETRVAAGTAPEGYDLERCRTGGRLPTRPFLVEFAPASLSQLNRALLTPTWGFGLEAAIGLGRFDYRVPSTLAEQDELRPEFSARGFFTLFPANGISMLTFSAGYESAYEALDAQILCRPTVTDPNVDCVSAAPGPPRRVERIPLSVEYRQIFPLIPGLGRFAVAPRIEFDAEGQDFEVALPIYLVPSRDIRLLPGFSVTYGSRDDEVVFGLFLRQRFGFGG